MNKLIDRSYPHLGKLSIAILESIIKPIIGDDSISQIKAPLEGKQLRQSIILALGKTEKRFIDECSQYDLTQAVLDLPLANLQSVQKIVFEFYEHPLDSKLERFLIEKIQTDYPHLPEKQIASAVSSYSNILRQELVSISPEVRDKMQTLATISMMNDIGRIADNIEAIQQELSLDELNGHAKSKDIIPPPPALIVGRQNDIAELKKRLGITNQGIPSTQILTAIRGWPGVGKTSVASLIARDPEVQNYFPDGVLWTSLGPDPNLFSEIVAWGRSLGAYNLQHSRSLGEAQTQLTALLRDKRMLLIIDDVWELEHAMPFNVGGHKCATLITTRLNEVAHALVSNPEQIYLLPVLTEKESLDLLKELAPTVVIAHLDQVIELAHDLEGLPLALQVAGRLLQSEAGFGFDVNELISELRDGAKLLEAKAPPDRTDIVNQTTPTISALLQKSTDLLDDHTRSCYAYLGVFAPKPATFDLDAMAYVWNVKDPRPIVRILVNRGLLEFVPQLKRYQMHALLVMQAKSLLS